MARGHCACLELTAFCLTVLLSTVGGVAADLASAFAGLTEEALTSPRRLSARGGKLPWTHEVSGNAFGSLGPWQAPSFRELLSAGGGPSAGLHALRLTHQFKGSPPSGPEQPLHSLLRLRDQARHGLALREGRLLQGTQSSTAPLFGATFPNGLYYVTLGIGSPPQYLNLNIDTGSNLLWVNCEPCQPCTTSQNQVQNDPYNPGNSSSARPLACNSDACINPDTTVRTVKCDVRNPSQAACGYSVAYADLSSSSGSLYTDIVSLPLRNGTLPISTIVGCGNTQTGNFEDGPGWTYYAAIDGLLGLGTGSFSIMSAIVASRKNLKLSPVLSHCLGGVRGGGWLAFGNIPIPEDEMPFTPLLPHATWYKVSIARITVGGRQLSINPSEYGKVEAGNAILDSGTTFSILPDPFVPAILNMIQRDVGLPPYTYSQTDSGSLCFQTTTKLSSAAIKALMPSINIQFTGNNVFLNVAPSTYAFDTKDGNNQLVCTQIQHNSVFKANSSGVLFILGDLWLRDRLVVHDLDRKVAGWASMDCS